jgi:hypothetical protein
MELLFFPRKHNHHQKKKRNKKHTNILSPFLPVTVETCGILSNAGHYTSLLLLYIHHSLSLSAAAAVLL